MLVPGITMATQVADLAFGGISEARNMGLLERHLSVPLTRQGHWDVFDYANEGKTVYVELKTRRIAHDRYPTAIIGRNKVDWCVDPTKQYWFAYCYTDGIYVIKYNKELFDTFQRDDNYTRGERADCPNNAQRVVYIPTGLLTPI